MKLFLFLLLCIVVLIVGEVTANGNVICYYNTAAHRRPGHGRFDINDIHPHACTHLMYAFLGLSSDGTIRCLDTHFDIDQGGFKKFTALKQHNYRLKTMISLGGPHVSSSTFSAVARSESKRQNFTKHILNFMRYYGFDGLDLAWLYPSMHGGSSQDDINFIKLLFTLHRAFVANRKLLSVAVAGNLHEHRHSYRVDHLTRYVDFINLLTFDYHTAKEHRFGHHAPLYASAVDNSPFLNINESVHEWIHSGADAHKLMLGVPLYARTYKLKYYSDNAIGGQSAGPGSPGPYTRTRGFLGYMEVCEKMNEHGFTTKVDSHTHTPYSYNHYEWYGYDTIDSIKYKLGYAQHHSLGGIMVWSIDMDYKHSYDPEESKSVMQLLQNDMLSEEQTDD